MFHYIDSHNHMQSLSYNEWELMAMTGLRGAVLSSTNPYIYREIMDEAPGLNQILRHWNQAIKLADASDEKFFMRLFVAVGISAMTFVRQTDELLERLEEYLGKPKVVALGEVGLDPVQYGVPWPLEEQKKVLREQFILAKKASKRVILHTPTPKSTADYVISLETATEKLPPSKITEGYTWRKISN